MKKILFTLSILSVSFTQAQILLNEVASTNTGYLTDEDGEFPDWVEIYNAGASSENLAGWGLTDNSDWNKWQLPDLTLAAGERKIIFASSKNRNCFTCVASSVNHWETAIFDADTWEYFIGDAAPASNWNDLSFSDTWSTGSGGFGYGDADDITTLPAGTVSVYYRHTFTIEDKTKLVSAILSMDYDDAFVAYLNGTEIARNGISGTPEYFSTADIDHEAAMYSGGNPESFDIDPALLSGILLDGENVLAVEIHNASASSSDLTGRTFLHFGISTTEVFYFDNPSWFAETSLSTNLHTNFTITNGETISLFTADGILADSVSVVTLLAGDALARIPDGESWCTTNTPTPDNANTGTCYSSYAAAPIFVTTPGFYDSEISVTLSGTEIHYTTDGSAPTDLSDLYTSALDVSASTVIRAINFESGKLPSPVATGSFFVNEETELPVVSISAVPCDLFNVSFGCPGAYDNAIAFYDDNTQVPCVIEYYNAAKEKQFVADMQFEVAGNYSIAFAQKGIQFVCKEEYNSPENIYYPIFGTDKPEITAYNAFRLRNGDDDAYSTRMRDVLVNRMALHTHAVAAGYQNVAAFINGEYWGHYMARERLDAYFLRDNFGCDVDSVDLIKTGFTFSGSSYSAEAGSDTAFYALVDFLTLNDMSDAGNYEIAKSKIDIENWIDYFATEIYFQNGDWLQDYNNNIRLFRSYKPEIKWKYILWDIAYGQNCSYCNTLSGSLSNPLGSLHADMFNALLNNTEFHDLFINRFADIMNEIYTTEKVHAEIDANAAEIESEIDDQNAQWGTGGVGTWNANVNALKSFHDDRAYYQRGQLQDYFSLAGQVDVTLEVNPPGAGYIKISTIIPEELPWTGVYFDGVPVTITAIPNPGYTFEFWDDNDFIDDETSITFTHNFTDNTTFIANFSGSAVTNAVVISEINYNSNATFNSGDWIELYNPSSFSVYLSDYIFSNKLFYNDFSIPTNTVIPAGGYLVVAENVDEFFSQHPTVTNVIGNFDFSLENSGDSVTLKDFLGNNITSFVFDDNMPWPCTADGFGRTMELTSPDADPALATSWFNGCMGGSPGAAFSACYENPAINEINYNSATSEDAGDWIELYNHSATNFNVSNFSVQDKNGNSFIIPAGTIIPAESYLAIYSDETKFSTQFPYVTNKVGPTNFGFASSGDVISIYDATGKIFQSVCYSNISPYPSSPDGGGTTLQLVDVSANLNNAVNWIAACPEGTPGSAYVTPCDTNILVQDINEETITLSPNPVYETLHILFENTNPANSELRIFTSEGKLILQQRLATASISVTVSAFRAGIYYLQIVSDDVNYTSAFIKK